MTTEPDGSATGANLTITPTPTIALRIPLSRVLLGEQPRTYIDDEAIRHLADSLASRGQLQPILVRREGEHYRVVAGHRRCLAAALLKWVDIEARVSAAESDADAWCDGLVENLAREDLRPVEKARAIQRYLTKSGTTAGSAAQAFGVSPASVSKLLKLLILPDHILSQVDDGAIALSTAYEIAREPDGQRREALASEVAKHRLSREQLTRKLKRAAKPGDGTSTTRSVAQLKSGHRVTVETPFAPTFDLYVSLLEDLLVRARKAKGSSLTLDTFLRTLSDRAKEVA